jgi:hypothetical protein
MVWEIVQAFKDRYGPTGTVTAPRKEERRAPARLYECPDCKAVYIADELESCGTCDTSVDDIPNEQDLGYHV